MSVTPRPLIAVIGQRCASVPILRFSATLAAEAICESVYEAGGEPAIFHGAADGPGSEFSGRLGRYDGVLMPGGADISPARYGEEPVPEVYGVVDFQDELDLAAAHVVLQSGLPTLAICRGLQVINVALGGSLRQHMQDSCVSHFSAMHSVSVALGSRLSSAVGDGPLDVSSYHHQCVDRLGAGLTVSARAEDGVIEGVELPGADLVAVQWHPEDLHKTSATDAALFNDLVSRAAARRDRVRDEHNQGTEQVTALPR